MTLILGPKTQARNNFPGWLPQFPRTHVTAQFDRIAD